MGQYIFIAFHLDIHVHIYIYIYIAGCRHVLLVFKAKMPNKVICVYIGYHFSTKHVSTSFLALRVAI